MTVHWTDAMTLHLIQLWEQFPCIYDQNLPDYTNRELARDAYKSIATELGHGLTETDIKNKMKSLRTSYGQQMVQMFRRVKRGVVSDARMEPHWKFWKPLHFLQAFIKLKRVQDELNQSEKPLPKATSSFVRSPSDSYRDSYTFPVKESPALECQTDEESGDGTSLVSSAEVPPSQQTPTSRHASITLRSTAAESHQHAAVVVSNTQRHPSAQHALAAQPEVDRDDVLPVRKKRRCPACATSQGEVDLAQEALSVLKSLEERAATRRSERRSENQLFFQMLAKSVEELPNSTQIELRLEMYRMVTNAKAKFYENS